MILARHLAVLLPWCLVIGLSSCSTSSTSASKQPADARSWWAGDAVEGSPRIVINLSEQRLRYFKGGKLVGVSTISSGREGNGTLNGKFRVLDKDLDHRSSLYGCYADEQGNLVVEDVDSRRDPRPPGTKFVGARMRYFMRIVGGIGMHEGYLPGYPASHGCIRLPTKMAAIFFEHTPQGTPVEVIGSGTLAAAEDAVPLGEHAIAATPPPPVETPKAKEAKPAPRLAATPKVTAPKIAAAPKKVAAAPKVVAVPKKVEVAPKVVAAAPKNSGETIRRAVLVEGSTKSAKGDQPQRRRWWKSPPPGTTLYLAE